MFASMLRLPLVLVAALVMQASAAEARESPALASLVREARAASPAPPLGAVVVRCAGSPEIAVDGVSRLDQPSPVTLSARFDIGSNAKSMLATLAATYVAEGLLSWDTEVGTVLAAEADRLDPVLRRATLAQLLSHSSGLPALSTGAELSAVAPVGDTPQAQRLDVALKVLRGAPAYAPGEETLYSNAGYIVAGAMLERLGGEPFEVLMRERVFTPLGMTGATFGAAPEAETDQPVGHYSSEGTQAVYLDPESAIPAFLQPAGDVSLTMADYGAYLREHLCGLEGGDTKLLAADVIERLHQPQGDGGVSMGWGQHAFGDAPASIHVGGTGTFSAFVAVLPTKDLAVATVINSGFDGSRQAALGLLQTLVQTYASEAETSR